ncbi:MAG: RagB/SusD family nutrient uptake outer membrane protein, partial [Paludibacteraceae bacterium]|nr:RagB/SusD family nutrient uptake outer membrane protein [Paludibacteraceae bacterium]
LFRYADVILMKKEALLRGGQDDAPGIENTAVDAIKKRAFAYEADPIATFDQTYPDAFTAIGTSLNDGILAERGRELTWENQRRRDLIRFGQFEKIQYVKNTAETRRWFPIPYTVLQKAVVDPTTGKKIWTQNPGY